MLLRGTTRWQQVLLGLFLLCTTSVKTDDKTPPHIICIMAPDLGWNDVSFHGSMEIPTPSIDALASSGIILQNYYTMPYSSPSRASFFTGLYPIHTGFQGGDIKNGEPSGLPLDVKLLPEYLKDLGYAAHFVGKWHLGFFKRDYMPLKRGFDSFLGCLNGKIDHYDYTSYGKYEDIRMWGVDFYEDFKPLTDFRGEYLNEILTDRATEVIESHNLTQPLFLFVSSTSPETGNTYAPLQAPPLDVRKFKHIDDIKRRTHAGAILNLDKTVRATFMALHNRGMTENCVFVFTSVNGAAVQGYQGGQGSNWPLRGQKGNLFEGGVRVPAFIWSPLLNLQDTRVAYQLMHVTDWLPTLYRAAGGKMKDLGYVDGMSMWDALLNDHPSPRTEMLLNSFGSVAALRIGDYKLIQGSFDSPTDWSSPIPLDISSDTSIDEWVWNFENTVKSVLENSSWWLPVYPDVWRVQLKTECMPRAEDYSDDCDPVTSPCLFNVIADPCEQFNLAQRYPRILKVMKNRLRWLQYGIVDPISKPIDTNADPRCHNFTYVPWMEEEFLMDYPFIDGF